MTSSRKFQGDWTITCTNKQEEWQQRFVIKGAGSGDGNYNAATTTGASVTGDFLSAWTLTSQHNEGSGWLNNEIEIKNQDTSGNPRICVIISEDTPKEESPAWDDLTLTCKAPEIELIKVPIRPYAMCKDTLEMTPEGFFDTSLGECYLYARVRNIWSKAFPSNACVRIKNTTDLNKHGITVNTSWTKAELESLNQKVSSYGVVIGALGAGKTKAVYFKVNCSGAEPQKYSVEFELEHTEVDDTAFKFTASQNIFVSRTGYDATTGEFYSQCDQGTLYLHYNKAMVEYTTLMGMIACSRAYTKKYGPSLQDQVRKILQDLLAGKPVDLCKLKRLLDRACEKQPQPSCPQPFLIPTDFEYRVEPSPPYTGKTGPLPYDDPWWKALLALIAFLFSLAAGASAAADVTYQSDEMVIGTLHESVYEPEAGQTYYLYDAGLCKLNGNRPLPNNKPPLQVLDARSDEDNQVPVEALDKLITLTGDYMTFAKIKDLIAKHRAHYDDIPAMEDVHVYKSGAKTGLTHAIMVAIEPNFERKDDDGETRYFHDQIVFDPLPDTFPDPVTGKAPYAAVGQAIAKKGDSGSLWIHYKTGKIVALHHAAPNDDSGSKAWGMPIEEVIKKLNISFK